MPHRRLRAREKRVEEGCAGGETQDDANPPPLPGWRTAAQLASDGAPAQTTMSPPAAAAAPEINVSVIAVQGCFSSSRSKPAGADGDAPAGTAARACG